MIAAVGLASRPACSQADHEVSYINGRFRAAYLLTNGRWYAKPLVDFDATRIGLDSINEHGAGGVSLNVRGNDETVLSATPALELGTQLDMASGTLVRPYVRGGATFFDDPDFVLLASFAGAPSGVGPFRIATSTDDVVGNVGAGDRCHRLARRRAQAVLRRPLRRPRRGACGRRQGQPSVLDRPCPFIEIMPRLTEKKKRNAKKTDV